MSASGQKREENLKTGEKECAKCPQATARVHRKVLNSVYSFCLFVCFLELDNMGSSPDLGTN